MKNVTISLEDHVYRRARVVAAEVDSSVTALVREFLEVLTTGDSHTNIAKAAILETIDQLRAKHPHFDPNNQLSREDIHQRAL